MTDSLISAALEFNKETYQKGKLWMHPEDFEEIKSDNEIKFVCGIPIHLTYRIEKGTFVVTDDLVKECSCKVPDIQMTFPHTCANCGGSIDLNEYSNSL